MGRNIFIPIILIIILGFAVYGNSLNGKFLWDDNWLVRDNAYIRSPSYFLKIFTESLGSGAAEEVSYYRPIQLVTYMIDYAVWKLDVRGYHLTNVILHILAALSIYYFINILFKDKLLSLFTSVFFIIHPIHTEAVAYISGRTDSLALIFMMLCFIFYIKSIHSENTGLYIFALLSYVLALLSRENSLVFPLLLLLYHYSFKKKVKIDKFLPILGLAFIYIALRFTLLKTLLSSTSTITTLFQRIPGFFVAITDYARLMLLPFGLHMEYGNNVFSFLNPRAILGVGIIVFLLTSAFIARRKEQKLISFSIFWFFIALLPSSNLYPVGSYMAEHWMYLPSLGVFLISAKGLTFLYRAGNTKIPAILLSVCLLIFYSSLTFHQNNYWKEPLTFYERTLKYAPNSIKSYNNLGNLYQRLGQKEKAITAYEKAIKINPNYNFGEVYNNLAVIYASLNQKEKAIDLFKKAIELNPRRPEIYTNLGIMYVSFGKRQQAIAAFKKAIELNPNYAIAHINLSIAYFNQQQYDLALEHCEKAIALGHKVDPTFLNLLKRGGLK